MGTSLEQFRECLRSDQARASLGLTLSAEDARWIAEEAGRSADYYSRRVTERTPALGVVPLMPAAPVLGFAPVSDLTPERAVATPKDQEYGSGLSGFVCSLIAIFFTTMPVVVLLLGIIGIVSSS